MADYPVLNDRFLRDDADVILLFEAIRRERVEVAAFVYLDADDRILGLRQTRSSHLHLVDVPIRAVTTDALSLGAAALFVAHNHPSGDCRPSRGDIDATRLLVRVLKPLGVRVRDHIVLAHADRTSFAQRGLL